MIIFAGGSQPAYFAFGIAGHADIAAMEDQPMMGDVDEVAGNEFYQLFFGGQGSFGAKGQADAGGYAEDMGIDGHIGLFVYDGGDDIGCLSAHAGELHQFIDGERDIAPEFRDQHPGHADQVFGLVVGIGYAFDQGEKVIEAGFCKGLRGRIFFEDRGGSHIDPLVGALRRQDDRYQ